MDHIDAILVGLEVFGFKATGNIHHDRARASGIEQALHLCGFKIVRDEMQTGDATEQDILKE